jgi:hypothetical protein
MRHIYSTVVGHAVRLLGVTVDVFGRQERLHLLLRHLRHGKWVACRLLLALPDREVGVERHPEYGDEDAQNVPHGEGVMQQRVPERQDQARLEVAQHLVRHRRRRPDHKERAEVHGHRDQAGQNDETHDWSRVFVGEDTAAGEELIHEGAGCEQDRRLVRRGLIQKLRRRDL